MSHIEAPVLNIRQDVEFVKNQLEYMRKYQLQIFASLKPLNSFAKKWKGLKEEEEVYVQIQRWVKCHNQLWKHLSEKTVNDKEVIALLSELAPVTFERPSIVQEDSLKGVKLFFYRVLPFYRINYHKKKIKYVSGQVSNYSRHLELLKKVSFKIESHYLDGL